jgi:acylglycerol lipase
MSPQSTAAPLPQAVVGSQLVRTWSPEGLARAEVVVVHGLAEHSGRYERTGSLLAEAGYHVTAPDLVGFGATGGRRAYVEDWAHYHDQIHEHVETAAATGRAVVLLGHSMGGLLALGYALTERPSPDGLVLSAPAVDGGARWKKAIAPGLARVAGTLPIPNGLDGNQLSRDPAVGEAYFADPLVQTSSTTRLGAEMFAAMQRARDALDRLDVPTFVVHGGLDTIVPPTATVALGALPVVERRLYPGLRHEVLNEPEGPQVVADMIAWIERRLDDRE